MYIYPNYIILFTESKSLEVFSINSLLIINYSLRTTIIYEYESLALLILVKYC